MTTDAMAARSGSGAATPRRPFRLLDAMILVAATAAGLGMIEWLGYVTDGEISWSAIHEAWTSLGRSEDGGSGGIDLETVVASGLIIAWVTLPIVISWTITLIPLRLLRPRPLLARLGWQPGLVAAAASTVMLLFAGLLETALALKFGWEVALNQCLYVGFPLLLPSYLGIAVLASWLTLAATRRWRAERSWIDRVGRAVGVYWITAGFLAMGGLVLQYSTSVCRFTVRNITTPDSENPASLNIHAWALATSPDAQKRDGRRAVKAAMRACELSEWQDAGHLDTLAAANAENGDFVAAVLWQNEALDRVPVNASERQSYEDRLELYERGEPYREDFDLGKLSPQKIHETYTPLP